MMHNMLVTGTKTTKIKNFFNKNENKAKLVSNLDRETKQKNMKRVK